MYSIGRQEDVPEFFGSEKEPQCTQVLQMTSHVEERRWQWITDGGVGVLLTAGRTVDAQPRGY